MSYNTQRLKPGHFFRLLASLPTPTSPTLPGSPSPANKEDSGDSATPSCQILISRSLGWQELHSAYIFVFKVSCVIHRVISRIFSNRDYGVLIEEAGIALRGLFIIDPSGVLRFSNNSSCIESSALLIRQMSINDLPVGRSVDETLRLIKAFQFVEKHGEVQKNLSYRDAQQNFPRCALLTGHLTHLPSSLTPKAHLSTLTKSTEKADASHCSHVSSRIKV